MDLPDAVRLDMELGRPQADDLLEALHIISQLADQRLELARNLVGQLRHGAAAGDIDKVLPAGAPNVNRTGILASDQLAGILDITRYSQRPGKIIRRPQRQDTDRRTVLLFTQTVDDLIQRAVSTRRDDHIESSFRRIRGRYGRVPLAGGCMRARLDPAALQENEDLPQPFLHLFAAGRRIVDQARSFVWIAHASSSSCFVQPLQHLPAHPADNRVIREHRPAVILIF